jgi:histidyl-tRNA synthetase
MELIPDEQVQFDAIVRSIRATYALFGFDTVDHRCVEPLDTLMAKGETSKEVYVLSRLQEEKDGNSSSKRLGLHFDLTVPFARYVVENAGHLKFPFRRSSIGKVWRGERPQAGRFREFYQADVDIVAKCENGQTEMQALPMFNDLEIVEAVGFALKQLESQGAPAATIHINNRKLLQGCYEALGVKDYPKALQIMDKLDKIGDAAAVEELLAAGETEENARKCISIAKIRATTVDELQDNSLIMELAERSDLAKTGLSELVYLLESVNMSEYDVKCVADLKITRGLDYYTGSVFETFLDGLENYGSVASGGRYANLTSSFDGKNQYPGVGMSIGVSRLFSLLSDSEKLNTTADGESAIMVIVNDETSRPSSNYVCAKLRASGVTSFVCPNSNKFGKQIDFAARRGVRFVLFIGDDDKLQLKNIETGEQNEYSI